MHCEGKPAFDRRGDAEFVAKRTRGRGYGHSMAAYRCPDCSKFHIGHKAIRSKKFRFKYRRK